jgi:hypothetical protein
MNKILYKSITAEDDNGEDLRLNYYILESEENLTYGLQVSKMDDKNNEIETAKIKDISDSRSEIKSILAKISKGTVTPFSLNEVIFEILDNRKYDVMTNFSYLSLSV